MLISAFPTSVFSDKERLVITSEINTLLEKAGTVKAHHEPGEFISPPFVRPKKNGSHRMILNLKNLNTHVEYNHFKMDTLESAIRFMTPGCYMASIDLKEAYYSVPIAKDHQKYLKFEWDHTLYHLFPQWPRILSPKVYQIAQAHLFCTA